MRPEPNALVDKYRQVHPTLGDSKPGKNYGYFVVPAGGANLHVISSGTLQDDWEHVSISLENRCPTWKEMCRVKDLFWGDDELVLQFHVPKSLHINITKNCLHLWKPLKQEIILPPRECV